MRASQPQHRASEKHVSTPGRHSDGRLLAYLFILPAVILVTVLMYYPMFSTFQESQFSSSFLSPTPRFIGFETYADMFGDDTFWQVVRNALIWTFAVVALQNMIGMAVAVLLNQRLPGQGIMRSIVLLPWVLPGVVSAILWRFMYDPQLGLINSILIGLGISSERTPWLAQTQTAMIALIITAVWKGFPFSTVIYLAGLQGVDKEQLEAAEIDGGNAVQRFFYVTLPSMSGIVRLNLLLTTIFTFNYFDIVWVMTRGGPLNSTHIFPTIIYDLGFGEFKFGEAAAYGVVAVAVLSIFLIFYLRELRQRVK